MLSGVKIDREQQKIWRSVKTYPPPTPRTRRALKSIAERAEHAGKTLLLLAAGEDRQKMLSGVKNDREQQKIWRSVKTYPPSYPRTPRAAESIAERAEHAGKTLLLLAAGEDRRKMLSGVKNDREQQKFGAASKLTPPPTPRTPRAAESIAERAEHAGRTLLLLLIPLEIITTTTATILRRDGDSPPPSTPHTP